MASGEDITVKRGNGDATDPNEDITVNSTTVPKGEIFTDEIFPLTMVSHGVTDVGNKRLHNEDACYTSDEKCIWFVADGMGGHNAGDFASQSIVRDIDAFFAPDETLEESVELLEKIIKQTNEDLIKKAADIADGTIIGSTIALLTTVDNQGVLLWAGDSRVYRIRSGHIEQLTYDHSLTNDMIEHGIIKPEEADTHPDANKITRAVGNDEKLELDYRKLSIKPGDRYILCSDGLTKDLSDEDILSIAGSGSTEPSNQALLKRALEIGGKDNVTTITVDFFKG
jgi:serine/threonine protein phosphatase PrpC